MAGGFYFALLVIGVALGVFLCVLGIYSLVAILQIAEDLRYIRSKSDIHVQRPKPIKTVLAVLVVISLTLAFLLVGFMLTSGFKLQ